MAKRAEELKNLKGGAMWFYSLPEHDHLCRAAESLDA